MILIDAIVDGSSSGVASGFWSYNPDQRPLWSLPRKPKLPFTTLQAFPIILRCALWRSSRNLPSVCFSLNTIFLWVFLLGSVPRVHFVTLVFASRSWPGLSLSTFFRAPSTLVDRFHSIAPGRYNCLTLVHYSETSRSFARPSLKGIQLRMGKDFDVASWSRRYRWPWAPVAYATCPPAPPCSEDPNSIL